MATEVIALQLTTDTKQAEQSVGNFKKQLKDATSELVNMSMKFGETSTQAAEAAKKVAKLKDSIGDAKALADTFNPDKKFVALGGALQGVTAGFSAFSGAMGVLGADSKETEKLLLKVQSAMALQQGISGIMGAVDSFKLLANTIKTQVVAAFSTMKGAIMATGLGLLVVAIASVAAAFSMMADKAEAAAKATKELKDITERFSAIGLKGELDYINKKEKLDVAKAKLAGKTETDIFNIQQDARKQRLLAQQREFEETKGIDVEKDNQKLSAIKNGIIDGQVAEAENQIKLRKIKSDANEKSVAEAKIINDKLKADNKKKHKDFLEAQKKNKLDELKQADDYGQELLAQDLANEAYADKIKLDNAANLLKAKQDIAQLALLNDPNSIDKKIAKMDADLQIELSKLAEGDLQRQVLTKQNADAVLGIKQTAADVEIELEAKKTAAKHKALDDLQTIFGTETAMGKAILLAKQAMAIQEMIMSIKSTLFHAKDTATKATISAAGAGVDIAKGSAKSASALPFPANIPLIIGYAAQAFGIITAIRSALKQVKGAGASSNLSTASSSAAVAAPIIAEAQTTRLDQSTINAVGNAAGRAYVLESDVSNNQERIRRLNRAARIN